MDKFAPNTALVRFKTMAEKSPVMADLIAKLSDGGYFSIEHVPPENEPEAYKLVVAAQREFEQSIVDGLKSGGIVSALAVVHTGRPCNPLSYTVTDRTPVLEELLKLGAVVACVYQEDNRLGKDEKFKELVNQHSGESKAAEYLQASNRFASYVGAKANLLDIPVKDVDKLLTKDMSGASYLVTLKDETQFFYSFQSYQAHTVGQNPAARRWAVWAGERPKTKVEDIDELNRRYEFLGRLCDVDKIFLKYEAGATLDQLLERGRVPTSRKNQSLEI